MAQPVWTLSVDLQTKTATFQSGMADAAKAARGSFNEIKEGAREMGAATGGSMMEARHGVMLLGEEFGVHLPRALTSFIASIGPVGEAMSAAFPFLAIVVGATLLLEHLGKLKEEGSKLTESQVQFGTTVANVLNGLDAKLLEAGIRTDELNNDHLGALEQRLQLIDHQSMRELVTSFDTVAKAADVSFATLKTHWYSWSAGSAGAKHALEEFKAEYDALLAGGDTTGATNKLKATLDQAKAYLVEMRQAKGTLAGDDKQLTAQENLVAALQATVELEQKNKALKESEKSNVTTVTENKIADDGDKVTRAQAQEQKRAMDEAQKLWEENYRTAVAALQENEREKIDTTEQGSAARLAAIDASIKEENARGLQETGFYRGLLTSRVQVVKQMADEEAKIQAEAGKQEAEHTLKMSELQIAAAREAGQMRMAQTRMTALEELDMELGFAAQEYNAKKQALNSELAALDQSDKEYENKKQALNNKLLELDKQFENQDQALLDQSQKKQLAGIRAWANQTQQAYLQGFAQTIMGKQSFAQAMGQVDMQIAEGALKTALMSLMQLETVQGRKRFGDARTAAADAYASAGNPFLGAIEAVAAFSTVMAFEAGGIVPGTGKGDIVPARLEPGEGIITKKVMEGLTNRARFGDSGGGDTHVHHTHNHYHINAIDGASVKGMLDKHAETFSRHFHGEFRKMNK